MTLVNNDVLSLMTTQKGQDLLSLSIQKPIMLIFLRHFGCQFCRQAMDELSKKRIDLASKGTELIFVHMAENEVAEPYFKKFNLEGVQHISDPDCRYYASFGLMKGSFTQLFGLQTWIRGFTATQKYGNEMGKHLGDNFQMPGAFMIHNGEIRDQHIHKFASDRPDYDKLVRCCVIG
ncbi:MAG: redoxin domain-containing protein [Saprospiraceae bacterium]|nr:redoxin domain-containing protein [Saprospiraceae bacterium]